MCKNCKSAKLPWHHIVNSLFVLLSFCLFNNAMQRCKDQTWSYQCVRSRERGKVTWAISCLLSRCLWLTCSQHWGSTCRIRNSESRNLHKFGPLDPCTHLARGWSGAFSQNKFGGLQPGIRVAENLVPTHPRPLIVPTQQVPEALCQGLWMSIWLTQAKLGLFWKSYLFKLWCDIIAGEISSIN